MKKTTPLLCLAIATLVFFACTGTNNNHPVIVSGEAVVTLDSTDTSSSIFRSWALAQQDIDSFGSLCHKYLGGDTPVQFYTVRSRDLVAAMGMNASAFHSPGLFKYPYIRVTLAFESNANQFKLYIQPVEGANLDSSKKKVGRPLFFRRDGSIDTTLYPNAKPPLDANTYVADLNAPCPNTCGGN